MSDRLLTALLIAAMMGSGLVGGLFFVFSNTIMKALDRLPAATAVAAMQSINVTILNSLFFLVFFGTAVVCVALLVVSVPRLSLTAAVLACSGALLYLIGSIAVTMVLNVPLNNQLAAVPLSGNDLAAQWQAYHVPWTMWNHMRTVACALAAVAFASALA